MPSQPATTTSPARTTATLPVDDPPNSRAAHRAVDEAAQFRRELVAIALLQPYGRVETDGGADQPAEAELVGNVAAGLEELLLARDDAAGELPALQHPLMRDAQRRFGFRPVFAATVGQEDAGADQRLDQPGGDRVARQVFHADRMN